MEDTIDEKHFAARKDVIRGTSNVENSEPPSRLYTVLSKIYYVCAQIRKEKIEEVYHESIILPGAGKRKHNITKVPRQEKSYFCLSSFYSPRSSPRSWFCLKNEKSCKLAKCFSYLVLLSGICEGSKPSRVASFEQQKPIVFVKYSIFPIWWLFNAAHPRDNEHA